MTFKTSRDLAKWMRQQDKAGRLKGELHALSNYVLGTWRIFDRAKREGKTIDARTSRFFKTACDRLNELIGALPDGERA